MSRLRRWPQTAPARQAPDVYELTRRRKPLTMTPGGDPLIENAAGNKNDDEASEHHRVIVASIRRRPFDAIDDEHLDGATLRIELEAELLLQRRKNRRRIVGGTRAG